MTRPLDTTLTRLRCTECDGTVLLWQGDLWHIVPCDECGTPWLVTLTAGGMALVTPPRAEVTE